MDKPIYVGTSIRDLSKSLMYCVYFFNNLKKKYDERVKLLYIRLRHTPNLPTKFHPDPSITFWDIFYTDRQTIQREVKTYVTSSPSVVEVNMSSFNDQVGCKILVGNILAITLPSLIFQHNISFGLGWAYQQPSRIKPLATEQKGTSVMTS